MAGKRKCVKTIREHDYLFDNTFTVSGEKDHNRMINKAAIVTAEVSVQPVFEQMFSDLISYPRVNKTFIPNAHLPEHIDLSYNARIESNESNVQNVQTIDGKNRFKYFTMPKTSAPVASTELDLSKSAKSTSIQISPKGALVNKGVQTIYRESSSQTDPYQPDYRIREGCETTPEVLLLEKLQLDKDQISGGIDKSMVQWVKRSRINRAWSDINPTSSVLSQLDYYERKSREKEIDGILLENLEACGNYLIALSRVDTKKMERLWVCNEEKLEAEIERIKKNRDRDIRKLELKRKMKDTKMENLVAWPPCVLGRIPFIAINTDFLPTFNDLKNKSFKFEKKTLIYERSCSKNKQEKHLTNIKKELRNKLISSY